MNSPKKPDDERKATDGGFITDRTTLIAARRQKVSEYLLAGMSTSAIAQELKWSVWTIRQDAAVLLEEWRHERLRNIDAFTQAHLTRLDSLLQVVWERALAGDKAAIEKALSIMDRQAKIIGGEVLKGRLNEARMSDEEVKRILAGADGVLGSADQSDELQDADLEELPACPTPGDD